MSGLLWRCALGFLCLRLTGAERARPFSLPRRWERFGSCSGDSVCGSLGMANPVAQCAPILVLHFCNHGRFLSAWGKKSCQHVPNRGQSCLPLCMLLAVHTPLSFTWRPFDCKKLSRSPAHHPVSLNFHVADVATAHGGNRSVAWTWCMRYKNTLGMCCRGRPANSGKRNTALLRHCKRNARAVSLCLERNFRSSLAMAVRISGLSFRSGCRQCLYGGRHSVRAEKGKYCHC